MRSAISLLVLLGSTTAAAAADIGEIRWGGSTLLYVPSSVEVRGELFLGEKASLLAGGGPDVVLTALDEGRHVFLRSRAQARFYGIGDHDDGWHASAGVGLWSDVRDGEAVPLWLVPISVGRKNPGMADVSITYNMPMFMEDFLGSDPQAGLALLAMWTVDLHFAF